MSICNRYYPLIAVSLIVLGIPTASIQAHDAPAAVPPRAATTAPASHSRDFNAIVADFQASAAQLHSQMKSDDVLNDPAKRSAIAPQAIPILKRLDSLRKELASTGSEGQAVSAQIGSEFEQLLLVFGDEETIAQNKAQAADPDPKVAAMAKQNQMFADWVEKPDEAEQAKLLASAQTMANDSPKDFQLCRTLLIMSQVAAATPDLSQRARSIAQRMQTPISDQLQSQANEEKILRGFQDKPIVVTGSTVEGKPFTTADWKGRVILVVFWATWCGPCRAELPRVKKAYADFHDKGLEVLGVSNDFDPKTLTDFVAAEPGMPWPQLLDPKAAAAQQWNPTTLGFGIDSIPTMFLIDKQGICKSVTARKDFETEIPKLLLQ